MIGLTNLLKKNLELRDKLPDKWKDIITIKGDSLILKPGTYNVFGEDVTVASTIEFKPQFVEVDSGYSISFESAAPLGLMQYSQSQSVTAGSNPSDPSSITYASSDNFGVIDTLGHALTWYKTTTAISAFRMVTESGTDYNLKFRWKIKQSDFTSDSTPWTSATAIVGTSSHISVGSECTAGSVVLNIRNTADDSIVEEVAVFDKKYSDSFGVYLCMGKTGLKLRQLLDTEYLTFDGTISITASSTIYKLGLRLIGKAEFESMLAACVCMAGTNLYIQDSSGLKNLIEQALASGTTEAEIKSEFSSYWWLIFDSNYHPIQFLEETPYALIGLSE